MMAIRKTEVFKYCVQFSEIITNKKVTSNYKKKILFAKQFFLVVNLKKHKTAQNS